MSASSHEPRTGTDAASARIEGRNPIWSTVWIGSLVLGPIVLYLMSYAPVVRWECRSVITEPVDGKRFPVYRPADWVIDRTPLAGAMFWWARLWNVDSEFRWARDERERIRRENLRRHVNAGAPPPPPVLPRSR
jgi:hypothetical protein